jgi:hypothetical protein
MILLYVHYHRISLQGRDPQRDFVLLERKQRAYEVMNVRLQASEEVILSDDTLYGIVSAAIAEHRLHGPGAAISAHLDAGLKILRSRKQLNMKTEVTYPLGLVLGNAYISIGMENFFTDKESLVAASSSLTRKLTAMQSWNQSLRQIVYINRHRVDIDGESPVIGHPSKAYIESRRVAVADDSNLRQHILRMLRARPSVESRPALAALFASNIVLWACRYNEAEAIDFVADLTFYLLNSEPSDAANGAIRITQLCTLHIIEYCASNLRRFDATTPKFDMWDAIKLVELMTLSNEPDRLRIRHALASWLLVPIEKPDDLICLSEIEVENMISDIHDKWVTKQLQHGKAHRRQV